MSPPLRAGPRPAGGGRRGQGDDGPVLDEQRKRASEPARVCDQLNPLDPSTVDP